MAAQEHQRDSNDGDADRPSLPRGGSDPRPPPLSLADASNRIRDLERALLEEVSHRERHNKRLKVVEDIALRQQKKIDSQREALADMAHLTKNNFEVMREGLLTLNQETSKSFKETDEKYRWLKEQLASEASIREMISVAGSLKRRK